MNFLLHNDTPMIRSCIVEISYSSNRSDPFLPFKGKFKGEYTGKRDNDCSGFPARSTAAPSIASADRSVHLQRKPCRGNIDAPRERCTLHHALFSSPPGSARNPADPLGPFEERPKINRRALRNARD